MSHGSAGAVRGPGVRAITSVCTYPNSWTPAPEIIECVGEYSMKFLRL